MVYMYHSFLIHLSADGHLGCFHVLTMINSAAMNIGVRVSLSDLVSLVCMPRSGIAETSAWTWCTGKTWRDRVEREVGGGIGMGNTCKPMAVSFQCMTKSTTIKKIINKKIKIKKQ